MYDIVDGSLPPREAIVLLKQLPEDSRTVAAMSGGMEHRGWTADRYMRAKLIDAINDNTHAFLMANSRKKPKAPKRVPTPSDKKRRKDDSLSASNPFARQLNAQLNKLKKESTDG